MLNRRTLLKKGPLAAIAAVVGLGSLKADGKLISDNKKEDSRHETNALKFILDSLVAHSSFQKDGILAIKFDTHRGVRFFTPGFKTLEEVSNCYLYKNRLYWETRGGIKFMVCRADDSKDSDGIYFIDTKELKELKGC